MRTILPDGLPLVAKLSEMRHGAIKTLVVTRP
jgi:hypothetical protein